MQLIVAIIKPFKLDDVYEVLAAMNIEGVTVTEVRGFGKQKGGTEFYRGAETAADLLPKLKLEIAVPDERVREVIKMIRAAACTGKIGDGKIFVLPLTHVERIRTGECDLDAL